MDDMSIIVYLIQIGLVGGWIYTLILGMVIVATIFFVVCVLLGVADNHRKDQLQTENTMQECLKND